jgi:hypothetical protein
LVLAACASSTPPKAAVPKTTPKPPHAVTVTLSLTGADPWEPGPEPGGCHGSGPYDDLKVGTPVQVSIGVKKLGSGTFTRSKNLIAACTLTATIDAVPAAQSYTFTFGGFAGPTLPYESVAKTWSVVVRL